MSDEPNSKMDEILRAYARERRKMPEPRVHPATRKMLQAEVVKNLGGSGGGDKSKGLSWRAFWPRLAFGGALCAILVLAIISLPRRGVERESAAGKSAPPPMISPEKDAARGRDESLNTPKLGKEPRGQPALEQNVQSTAEPLAAENQERVQSPAAAPVQQPLERERLADKAEVNAPKEPALEKSKVLALTPQIAAAASGLTNLGAARRLDFVQIATTNASGVRAEAPVLRRFQLEQFGTRMRLIDNDGSVYIGELEANARPQAAVAGYGRQAGVAASARAFPAAATQAVTPENAAFFSFQAQGTNRTLGREVVVSGEYFEKTNASADNRRRFGFAPNSQALSDARRGMLGTAVIGKTNQVPLQAVSTEQ